MKPSFLANRRGNRHCVSDLYMVRRARDKLASTAVEYLDTLAPEAGSDPDLAWELLNAYDRLSQTRGGVGTNIGRTEEAFKLSEKVVQLAESLEARGSIGGERLERLFVVYDGLGRMYLDMRRKPEAEDMMGERLRLGPRLRPFRQAAVAIGMSHGRRSATFIEPTGLSPITTGTLSETLYIRRWS